MQKKNYEYFNNSYIELKSLLNNEIPGKEDFSLTVEKWKKDFVNAMDDDFNTPVVIALLHEIFKSFNTNKNKISRESLYLLNDLLVDIFNVLGFKHIGESREETIKTIKEKLIVIVEELSRNNKMMEEIFSTIDSSIEASQLINILIEVRNNFRNQKKFKEADLIRDSLKKIGVVLEDTKDGTKYKLEMIDEQ